ncbi:MAG: tRNA (adenosine(37)-N6)-dimethylallyltransferase MiaA [Patescibacteria group bacterium]
MQKIISIIGPTATGKTSLALKIADQVIGSEKYSGVDVISVDSRQVYKGLEIVSGADLPEHLDSNIKIHGVSIINPDQEWSLAHFRELALEIISNAKEKNNLVILVGGTGLYHSKLIPTNGERIKTNALGIKPDLELRKKLDKLSVPELQAELQKVDKKKLESMNNSDRQNPRRLIRAIEIANAQVFSAAGVYHVLRHGAGVTERISIGLSDGLENINNNIKKRVLERFENGAVEEVRVLIKKFGMENNFPALSATGVKEISKYLDKKLSKEECIKAWTLREYQYAKRQITWWKKNKDIRWYEVSDENWEEKAQKKILDFVL